MSLVLFLFSFTLTALSNFFRSMEATISILGMVRQQTRTVHEPETPWHLHVLPMLSLITLNKRQTTNFKQNKEK